MRESSNDDGLNATIHENGSAVLVVDETPRTIATSHAEDARREIVRMTAEIARQIGSPMRVIVSEPDGTWPLVVDGNENVEYAAPEGAPRPVPRAATPSPAASLPEESPITRQAPRDAATQSLPVIDPAAARARSSAPTLSPAGSAEKTPAGIATPRVSSREFADRRAQRETFLTGERDEQLEEPATRGFRGAMTRMGLRMAPGESERSERSDQMAVAQHWPGPRTIAVVNGKGGSGKTPTTILTAAVFARFGGAGVLAWDNNQTRGTLGWRTEQGAHDATLHDLLEASDHLLSAEAQAADVAHYVHHQRRDRFDVLRSQPIALAEEQRISADDVDHIHAVAARYYRLIVMDSGNDESDPLWRRMIDHTDQLVVATTTRDEHAEAGALLLDALAERDERSAQLAANAVTIVNQADSKAPTNEVRRVVEGYRKLTRDVVQIPFDPAIIDGHLHFAALRPDTQRAWLAATATIARGLVGEA
ncbi:AAA family ATPase [Microbacterium amylolyticum]|uniref:MinD-like ATPase involved in chromosome partitioning or flagellar assembly n=1 Tax=Microbacterium amylolyticum TaxID=936337 RepID=A0ABS4ZH78_9MICO|nr:AAA family ATPase [Microbacterium amylolyticum]MBP2436358.1 MinD-like ATPase involved in chromosome partitioning or flagellar assembly [Microbacterium amylolyticum]